MTLYSFSGAANQCTAPQTDVQCRGTFNSLCTTNKPSPLSCSIIGVLLSISVTNTLADTPTHYGIPSSILVNGPSSTPISPVSGFTGLLSPAPTSPSVIQNALTTANVIAAGAPTSWWSGSNSDGTESTDTPSGTCTGWTVTTPTVIGGVGNKDVVTGAWLAKTSGTGCNGNLPFVCFCAN
jgi:hypothetical protein